MASGARGRRKSKPGSFHTPLAPSLSHRAPGLREGGAQGREAREGGNRGQPVISGIVTLLVHNYVFNPQKVTRLW